MWRTRRWRLLLNVIDHLPRHSAYGEAISQDDDVAALILAHPPAGGAPAVRVSDWSPEREILAEISDRISTLTCAVIAAAGARPPAPRPSARPQTAADRLRDRNRRRDHLSLAARVLPEQADRDRAAAELEELGGVTAPLQG